MQASKDSGPVKVGIKMEPGESTLEFPGFTFDVGKLVSRSAALFPFLTRTLSFNVEKPPRQARDAARQSVRHANRHSRSARCRSS